MFATPHRGDYTLPDDVADAQSPYEVLLESIAYQSISGKAAATIFERIKALSATRGVPTPEEILKFHKPMLRKPGFRAQRWCDARPCAKDSRRVVPSHDEAVKMSDEELVERLVSVPRDRRVDRWNVPDFPFGPADVLPNSRLAVKKGWSWPTA